jgi:predicted Zn-dependent peptidase
MAENVRLHVHPNDQFKDVSVNVEFMSPLVREERAGRLVLSLMLQDVCAQYPTKLEASRAFDELYGATLSMSDEPKGKADIFECSCTAADQRFLKEKDILQRQFELIGSFLLHPLAAGERFSPELFEENRQKAVTMVRMALDQPMSYAADHAATLYGGYYADRNMPAEEELNALTNAGTMKLYHDILDHAAIDIFVLGHVRLKDCAEAVRACLPFADRRADHDMIYLSSRSGFDEQKETRPIGQSYLVLLYDTQRNYLDPLEPALMLGNGILGALPTSFLFQEVREKRSLCYTIGSENSVYEGILKISTAMESKNTDLARQLIDEQIGKVKAGAFDEEMLETARRMYINSWRSSMDHVKSILWDDYRGVILKDSGTIADMIRRYEGVKKEDITAAFSRMEPKAAYLLAQEEAHE